MFVVALQLIPLLISTRLLIFLCLVLSARGERGVDLLASLLSERRAGREKVRTINVFDFYARVDGANALVAGIVTMLATLKCIETER